MKDEIIKCLSRIPAHVDKNMIIGAMGMTIFFLGVNNLGKNIENVSTAAMANGYEVSILNGKVLDVKRPAAQDAARNNAIVKQFPTELAAKNA